MFDQPPVLCGHRGMGKGTVAGCPENTLRSCLAAVDAGLDWLEVDVRMTNDDVLVAAHHPTIEGGRFYADLKAEECSSPDLMRIEDLLDSLPAHVAVNLDVKSSLDDALRTRERTTASLLGRLLHSAAGQRRILVTSFDPAALLIARESAPAAAYGLLTWVRFPLRKAIPAARHLDLDVVAAHVGSFSVNDTDSAPVHHEARRSVDVAHEAGLEVAVWCPTVEEMPALVTAGVDCLVVNDVPAAVAALPTTGRG